MQLFLRSCLRHLRIRIQADVFQKRTCFLGYSCRLIARENPYGRYTFHSTARQCFRSTMDDSMDASAFDVDASSDFEIAKPVGHLLVGQRPTHANSV